MSCYPNLFIPGAAKSGTSSLHEYLNQHPYINMSIFKEPHFFCENRTEDEWKNYLNMFNDTYKYNGESSTGYMVFDNVIERIEEVLSDVKFIFILRNPIDRMISHYNWLNGLGCEDKNILEAFKFDFSVEPKAKVKPRGPGYKNYYQWGLYYKYLKRFYEKFPPENILVITTESLQQTPQNTLNKCTDFLGLERYEFDTTKKSNESISIKNKKMYFFINYVLINNKIFKFLNKQIFKKIYQILPLWLKDKLRYIKNKTIKNLHDNKNPIKDSSCHEVIRKELKKHYFDDVQKLKILIKYNLIEWKDFV